MANIDVSCDICFGAYPDVIAAYSQCTSCKLILCFKCSIKYSENKEYLSCVCSTMLTLKNIVVPNEGIGSVVLNAYINFYKKKYENTLVYIQEYDARISKYSLQDINDKIKLINYNIDKEMRSDRVISKLVPGYYPSVISPFSIESVNLRKTFPCGRVGCNEILNYDLTCKVCGYKMCDKCEEEYHDDSKCDEEKLKNVELMKRDINFSHCPDCHADVKREKGCDNVTCWKCNRNFNIMESKLGLAMWKEELKSSPAYCILRSLTITSFKDYMLHYIINKEMLALGAYEYGYWGLSSIIGKMCE